MVSNFKINKAALKRLEQNVQKQVPGVQVPLGGSESDAICDVKDQLRKMGVTPNDSAITKMVRDVRRSQGNG